MRLAKGFVAWALCLGLLGASYPRRTWAATPTPGAPSLSVEAPSMPVTAPIVVPCIGGQPALLSVDLYTDLSLPVEDTWQVMWNQIPISDVQLAWLADDDQVLASIRDGLDTRGPWVFAGLVTAATGTALSSVGWALLGGAGDNHLSNGATLTMALGGLVLGVAGLLVVADFMQAPLEPFMAPTPKHRVARDRAEQLVVKVNRRFMQKACPNAPAAAAQPRS